ncbi:MAG: type II toxin-antitoxin system YafQ family toxin [Thermoguttaceae bacterium]
MRKINRNSIFKKDFKRVMANPRHARDAAARLEAATSILAEDRPLPQSYRDHALTGDWNGYRECHLKPDLLLIYRTEANDLLRLARLGSHSELFR